MTATTTATNGLPVDNPAIEQLGCGTGNSNSGGAWCTAHPTAWEFGTDTGLTTKPVGKQTITVAFGDGTSGIFTDYVYNGWQVPCGQSIAFEGSSPTIVTSGADITYDCANQAVDFPHGAVLAAAPATDQYGNTATVMTTVTTPVAVPAGSPTSIPFSSIQSYGVYVIATSDGGFAKVWLYQPGGSALFAMSLHSASDGSYAY